MTHNDLHGLETEQLEFYLSRFKKYSNSYKSLSWRDKKSQTLSYDLLTKLFYLEKTKRFSVHEVGCGLAHFYRYLTTKKYNVRYSGSDIVEEMISFCKKTYPQSKFDTISIIDNYKKLEMTIGNCDYYCLSGTFNPKEHTTKRNWENFIHQSITNMFSLARKGIAFNLLTSHSDYYDSRLYYANPGDILNWCITHLSRFAFLHHDGPLYGFTVYVYKEKFIEKKYPYLLQRKRERKVTI